MVRILDEKRRGEKGGEGRAWEERGERKREREKKEREGKGHRKKETERNTERNTKGLLFLPPLNSEENVSHENRVMCLHSLAFCVGGSRE